MTSANEKGLGFWTLTFLVVANMIGAGVFTTSGYTLESLRDPKLVGWVLSHHSPHRVRSAFLRFQALGLQ